MLSHYPMMRMGPAPMMPMYYPAYMSAPMPTPPISSSPAPPPRTSAGTPPSSQPTSTTDAQNDTTAAPTDAQQKTSPTQAPHSHPHSSTPPLPHPPPHHGEMFLDPMSAAMYYGRSMPMMSMNVHPMNMMIPQMVPYHPYAQQPPMMMQQKGTPPSPHSTLPFAPVPAAGSSASSSAANSASQSSSELAESSSPKTLKRSRADALSESPAARRRSPHSTSQHELSNSVDAASTLLLSLSAPKSPSNETTSSPIAHYSQASSALPADTFYKRYDDVNSLSAHQQQQLQAYAQVHAPMSNSRPSLPVSQPLVHTNGSVPSNKWLKASDRHSDGGSELETIDDIVMGNRRHRRKSGELDMEERWNCPLGCGKFYRRTSSRSIHQHMADCPLIRSKQATMPARIAVASAPNDTATVTVAITAGAPANGSNVSSNGRMLEALINNDFVAAPITRQVHNAASPPPSSELGKPITPIAEGIEVDDQSAMRDGTTALDVSTDDVTAKAEPTDNDEMDIPPLIPHTNGQFPNNQTQSIPSATSNNAAPSSAAKTSAMDLAIIKCSMCSNSMSVSSSSRPFHICPHSDCDKAYCPECIQDILTFIHQKQHAIQQTTQTEKTIET